MMLIRMKWYIHSNGGRTSQNLQHQPEAHLHQYLEGLLYFVRETYLCNAYLEDTHAALGGSLWIQQQQWH